MNEIEQLAEFLFYRGDPLYKYIGFKWDDLSEKRKDHWRMDARASIALLDSVRRSNEATPH